MAKFSAIALTIAGAAAVGVIGMAASAAATTLPSITSSGFTSGTSSSSTSSSPPETTTSTPPPADPSAITADIYVELTLGEYSPVTFEKLGVVIDGGIELAGANPTSNLDEICADVTVDVSLDPTTITVTGGESQCDFDTAFVRVTLNGVEFSSVTLNSNNLFGVPIDKALGVSGGSYMGRSAHFGATDPSPVLDSFGVSGATFTAFWSGGNSGPMNGVGVFRWVPVAKAGAGAAADANFTG